jgi:hypothetical protein
MKLQEHLLTIVSEECAEIAQRSSKAIRFGLLDVQDGQKLDNAERLVDEFHDLIAVMLLMEIRGIMPSVFPTTEQLEWKIKRKIEYIEVAKKFGTIDN